RRLTARVSECRTARYRLDAPPGYERGAGPDERDPDGCRVGFARAAAPARVSECRAARYRLDALRRYERAAGRDERDLEGSGVDSRRVARPDRDQGGTHPRRCARGPP